MCYEVWRRNSTRTTMEEAKKRVQEMLERARGASTAPKSPAPSVTEREKERVPA